MSWAFITAIRQNPHQSYVSLLNSLRDVLGMKYTQKPQLSCSHPLGISSYYFIRRGLVGANRFQTRISCSSCDIQESAVGQWAHGQARVLAPFYDGQVGKDGRKRIQWVMVR